MLLLPHPQRLMDLSWPSLTITFLFLLLASQNNVSAYKYLSDDTLHNLLPLPNPADFDIHTGALLSPILIPRVPGSEGSRKVLGHFASFFADSLPKWKVSYQNSSSKTPTSGGKEVPFVNLIAYRDPPWAAPGSVGRLTLVAHYDSLSTIDGFIGATDSAAPCAMIMHAIRSIDDALTRKWEHVMSQPDFDIDFEESKGIQVLFLDGEEAFMHWSDTDSLYGARALAQEWEHTFYPATSVYKNYLDSIDLFVLLDLLGSPDDIQIPSWQHSSHWSYVKMAEMEVKLRNMNLFRSKRNREWLNERTKKDSDTFYSRMMLDDHIPFIERGVQVLHLIPAMFPSVWHTIRDDAEHLDVDVTIDWALLTSAFAAEYMELEGYFGPRPVENQKERDVKRSRTDL